MIVLQNGALRVEVLDPVADTARLGSRFCWAGYVWQVHDATAGPLLAGPEWPASEPSPFNGQGLPESFRHRTTAGEPLTWRGDTGVAIGAAEIYGDPATRAVMLGKPCTWQITPFADRFVAVTQHEAAGFAYELVRTLELSGREVRSTTRLMNCDDAPLKLEWFAHPFFPVGPERRRAEFPAGSSVADNPGFAFNGRMLMQKRDFVRQDDGHMDRVQLATGQPLVVVLPHAKVGSVRFETSFVPSSCVIWGNDRTFSIEPYLTLDLAANQHREWTVRYVFGPS